MAGRPSKNRAAARPARAREPAAPRPAGRFIEVYERLLTRHGPQHWWPGETPFEVMVGAILTQNAAWTNVEKAIANLTRADALDPQRIARAPQPTVARWIRPAGYFNVKAKRLRSFCRWYLAQGGYEALARWDTEMLRDGLLSVHGIGHETADDILLYGFDRPVFVIDAYTRRVFSRLGLVDGEMSYEELRKRFERALSSGRPAPRRVRLFNEYHALIVRHGKEFCRKLPRCAECCLNRSCPETTRGRVRT